MSTDVNAQFKINYNERQQGESYKQAKVKLAY